MEEKVFSVRELNSELKKVMDMFFANILLEAEVSSIKFHHSGNVYLTLKDEDSVIDAAIFKNYLKPEYSEIKEGSKILVRGGVSVFVKGGKYSFSIREVKLRGKGDLFEQFLKLKEKLEKEGLFDDSIKKPIPAFPRRVGVVTAPDGAAVKDILTVSARRFPGVDFIIFPAQVQGEGAVSSIIQAIRAANILNNTEVLIIGRGGGSYEELSVFNDEKLAYVILESKIPTISAVGHEKDFTIADFVADKRAATPSQAAEIVVPDKKELSASIENLMRRLERDCQRQLQYSALKLSQVSPERLKEILEDRIENHYRQVDSLKEKLDIQIKSRIEKKQNHLSLFYHSLEKLNPLYLLNKSYSISYNEHGKAVQSIGDIHSGEKLKTRVLDGWIFSRVENKISVKESEK